MSHRQRPRWFAGALVLAVLGIGVLTWSSPGDAESPKKSKTATPTYQVFAWNDLGMHCYDSDYSMFSLLPPFNTVHAQVVQRGSTPKLLTSKEVSVTFAGTADPSGSINTTSALKTNFWTYSPQLFGANLPVDQGLTGTKMPGLANTPRVMDFTGPTVWTAMGIPITSYDDKQQFNPYPMMRFAAIPKGKTQAATTLDAVVPVSNEMDCKACHATGKQAANDLHVQLLDVQLSDNANIDLQSRENILKVHDARYDTNLWETRPVLCASCHYSKALDLAGTGPSAIQAKHEYLSRAMHNRHGKTPDNQFPSLANPAIISDSGVNACYKCHPGNDTNCLRSVMATEGMSCQNCHGDLLAVGGSFPMKDGRTRDPWSDLPKCQSCHTGDFVSNTGGELPRLITHDAADPAATPVLAPNSRFAETPNTLYRNSTGHGGLACAACHGSPHAEWPATDPLANDNITPRQLQGHAGVVSECATCHDSNLALTMKGPHGLHNINSQAWVNGHEDLVEKQGVASCQACHGLDLKGTHLSVAQANRSFTTENRRKVTISAGTAVGCNLCHKMPSTSKKAKN